MPDSKDSSTDLEKIKSDIESLKQEVKHKDQMIEHLLQRLYGKKSERYDPNQLQFDFDEATLGKPEPGKPGENDSEDGVGSSSAAKKPRSKKRDLLPRNIAVVVREVVVPPEVEADPDAYKQISEEYHDELEIQNAHLYYSRVVMPKYRKIADKNQPPLIAPAPEPTVPGTKCGAQLIAKIIADKYCDHLPHYRQANRFLRQQGAIISRQTINSWTHSAAGLLSPIGEALKKEILLAEILQIDETPSDYLMPGLGRTATGYYWVYRNQESGTVYFDWQTGRGHECMFDMLGYDEATRTLAYTGKIQCDGYSAYIALANKIKDLELAGCLAHIRRKFFEARALDPNLVDKILRLIQILYRYEARKGQPPPTECRLIIRRGHSKKYADELKSIIDNAIGKHLPKSALGEALTYAQNQWDSFIAYLDDGRLEIDNNLIENAIRPPKLGLKNYLFVGSAEAGHASALLYTIIANCKVVGIDPERYLATVLERLTLQTTPEEAARLTPIMLAEEIKASQPIPAKYDQREAA